MKQFNFNIKNEVLNAHPELLELWNVVKGRALISYTIARSRGYYAVNFTIK